ncbi:MAG: HAD-IA family hydrolase [Clostridiales bacterium]|nr:HAD-IA family hydrolase [Clostridiales bacterium]
MNNINLIVFDIGETLMEYKNMPNVWIDFYLDAFINVRQKLNLNLSDKDISLSVEKLKFYNPRVNYRETDYPSETIFNDVTAHWKCRFTVSDVIGAFFSSIKLTPYIYPETIEVLEKLKSENIKIAVLTDVPTGMPDELHKSYFKELLKYFDMYVSSVSCGYRKPNPKGLQDIAGYFSISADNMIFVGDEEKDIQTAKRFGCASVLIDRYNSNIDFGQNYTIKNLNELINIAQITQKNIEQQLFAYHVVTEKPMRIGQHIIFDENHHNGIWQRVNEKLDIVNDIYNHPEKYGNVELEHHTSVALRELALEKIRLNKYPNYPSRMACLYVSKTIEDAEKWFKYFVSINRPTFQIVKLKVNGNVFYGDAEKCFDGKLTERENLILAEMYWENKNFDKTSIVEILVDGDIEVIKIVNEV